jgi:hypothetical protein
MSQTPPPDSQQAFRSWLRTGLRREARVALVLLAALPFLFLAAKLPLRYAERLVHVAPPEPKPGETIPPMGGA